MPHYKLELEHAPRRVGGVDEAGCGPWAGPVVAAAVIFEDRKAAPRGLNDSKQLDRPTREKLYDKIHSRALAIGLGIASVEEIDTLNIWWATALAMERAVAALAVAPEILLVDGNRLPRNLPCEARKIIRGDAISLSIAAASIVAKVSRDRLMTELAAEHPHYGFDRHVGYGTKAHQAALRTHGPCAIHRRSWGPIRCLLEGRDMFAYLDDAKGKAA